MTLLEAHDGDGRTAWKALDSAHPEDLWNWMDTQRKAGNELLAISHNANLSDGWMYPIDLDSFGRPIDAAWASSYALREAGLPPAAS